MGYSKRKCLKSVIITGLVLAVSFALGGCGEKSVADIETETAAIAATETEYTMPTEKEAAVAETEVATETEEETEAEDPVLFRIRISYGDGVNIGDLPSNKEANEIMWVDRGTEFDVYSIYENEDEGHSYYEVRYNGKKEYVWVEDAEIIE